MAYNEPPISWDWGTAYDLFASLHVLHHPDRFGLRGAWAAGVRSRLTTHHRSILEDAQELFFSNPLAWVSTLPDPKDAASVIRELNSISSIDRLPTLAFHADESSEIYEILIEVSSKRSWNDDDYNRLRFQYQRIDKSSHSYKVDTILNWWSRMDEFGERYLAALQAYFEAFFAEEEIRIKPYLQQALERAQMLAAKLDFSSLFVELSQGVMIFALEEADEVKYVPSYWITPLVMYDRNLKNHWVVLFGARPADVALVPGEVVPDAMLRALKVLSDPTRLLILRYLSDNPQNPTHLARKLRLRAPTVIHHLNALRLAGLVYVSMDVENEKRYSVRETAVNDTYEVLRKFLLMNGERP